MNGAQEMTNATDCRTPAAQLNSALLLILLASPLRGQATAPTTIAGLGTLTFPVTTTSQSAREDFLRGTLLLHLFHYPQAATAFRAAEQSDPGFTMAYWGEAMAFNWGVWNEQYPDSGRAALARLGPTPAARAAKARTARERGYLEAVELLYGPGTKPHRDTLYAAAMDHLSHAYPQDDEAKLFDALALLGLNQGVRDVPTYLRAYALAHDVFVRHPDHPGASHYVIHSTDDPAHATMGLDAARALAKSSPAAEHAQHMTSHIFMALGMWDDLVIANERATHADSSGGDMPGMNARFCGHGNSWLDYGYVAQGRSVLATRLLERCQAQATAGRDRTRPEDIDPDASQLFSAVSMWSHWLIDTEQWDGAQSRWQPAIGAAPGPRITWHFAHGVAAARRGDMQAARADLAALQVASADAIDRAAKANDTSPETIQDQTRTRALDLELQGLISLNDGKHDAAITLLRRATAVEDSMPYAFGPPYVDKPSHELLGEALLQLGQGKEALAEFRRTLKDTPLRPIALRGLARALESAGMTAEAHAAWRSLAGVWHGADAGLPGLDEARLKAKQ
jgi:tetratricopeptide (TPR) repeat protein